MWSGNYILISHSLGGSDPGGLKSAASSAVCGCKAANVGWDWRRAGARVAREVAEDGGDFLDLGVQMDPGGS